jgi:hypothetical protein
MDISNGTMVLSWLLSSQAICRPCYHYGLFYDYNHYSLLENYYGKSLTSATILNDALILLDRIRVAATVLMAFGLLAVQLSGMRAGNFYYSQGRNQYHGSAPLARPQDLFFGKFMDVACYDMLNIMQLLVL